jgi:hypothetical protein
MPNTTPTHEIVIEIGPDGKIKSTVNGIEGPTCSALTKFLEELGTVEVDSPTADYRKLPKQTVKNGH